jgi:hypothetical protein
MTGVEILAMEEVATEFAFNGAAFWIVACIVFGMFLVPGVVFSISENNWYGFIVFCVAGLVVSSLFGAILGSAIKNPIEYEAQYKVIISDEVSMNDFLEKYEIVDQEGKIYTVVERGVEE